MDPTIRIKQEPGLEASNDASNTGLQATSSSAYGGILPGIQTAKVELHKIMQEESSLVVAPSAADLKPEIKSETSDIKPFINIKSEGRDVKPDINKIKSEAHDIKPNVDDIKYKPCEIKPFINIKSETPDLKSNINMKRERPNDMQYDSNYCTSMSDGFGSPSDKKRREDGIAARLAASLRRRDRRQPPPPCLYCNESFKKEGVFKTHLWEAHRFCLTCLKPFPKGVSVEHDEWCPRELPVPCKICTMRFRTLRDAHNHTKGKHYTMGFGCYVCREYFPTEKSRVAHRRNCHSEMPVTCHGCPETFVSLVDLFRHVHSWGHYPEPFDSVKKLTD